jgi:DNA-binding MarR family transcriptional regulator
MAATATELHPVEALLSQGEMGDGYRLSFLANHMVGPAYAAVERDHGLTRPEFLVLFILARQDGLTSSDIVALSGLPKNSISRGVQLAESKGFIRRRRDPDDGRRAFLLLEASGRALHALLLPQFTAQESKMLGPLDANERHQFGQLLAKLVTASDHWTQSI